MFPRVIFTIGYLLFTASQFGPGLVADQEIQQPRSSAAENLDIVSVQDVSSHETGVHKPIRLNLQSAASIFESVQLTIVVAPDGSVASAKPENGPAEAYAQAIAEAMTWKYAPFEKDGHPIGVRLTDYVGILPLEELPKTHVEFPRVSRLQDVVMTLSRSGCFGTCPSYGIEISGDGMVYYKGEAFVLVTGEHHDRISPEKVSELLDRYRAADYFSLKDEYSYPVTDNPTFVTSIRIDQISKTVTDYVGAQMGMPQSVTDLEYAIDRIADSEKWVVGNAETISSLKREGWDFRTSDASAVLARASEHGNSSLVHELLSEGADASRTGEEGQSALAAAAVKGDRATVEILIKAGAGKDDAEMKTQALAAAAQSGDLQLVRLLIGYGADPKGKVERDFGPTTVLMSAALSSVPEVIETVLAAHPDVNAKDGGGHTALLYVEQGNTYWDERRHSDRAQAVHLLARAGEDLNAQDKDGNTALHQAFDAEVAAALIEDGANIEIRNNEGETPLMTNVDADATRLLLAAGADIHARNHEGKTALEIGQESDPNGERVQILKSAASGSNKKLR